MATPLQCSCLGNPRDGSLVGCHLWSHRVGHDWSDLAAVAAAAVYTCQSQSPNLSPRPNPDRLLPSNHKFVLYICNFVL